MATTRQAVLLTLVFGSLLALAPVVRASEMPVTPATVSSFGTLQAGFPVNTLLAGLFGLTVQVETRVYQNPSGVFTYIYKLLPSGLPTGVSLDTFTVAYVFGTTLAAGYATDASFTSAGAMVTGIDTTGNFSWRLSGLTNAKSIGVYAQSTIGPSVLGRAFAIDSDVASGVVPVPMPAPEPGTIVLLGSGLLGMGNLLRRSLKPGSRAL